QALLLQERKADQLQAAQRLVETSRTSRNCFLLAKALVLNQRFDMAEQMCLAGIKLDPTDVHCLLGEAALTMRKGDDVASLKLAQDLLDKARRQLQPESDTHLYVELDYLTAIHQALSGEPAFARLKLERMKSDHPDVLRYQQALGAIGR